MLVAYKPYSLLDLESHPLGVLPETPWSMEYIEDSQAGDYAEQGWVIVTMDEYLSLITSLSPLNSKSMALAAIKSGTIVLTPEQEQVIKDWYYTLNDQPVKTTSDVAKDKDGIPITVAKVTGTDDRTVVQSTPRPRGTYTYFTGAGDNPADPTSTGGTSNITDLIGHHLVGAPISEVVYADFNAITNQTFINEGYIQWKDALNDCLSLEIVPRVTPWSAGTNTNFIIYGGYLILPAAGNGNITVNEAEMKLVECTPNEFGVFVAGYWNATFNPVTKVFENITPAPLGDGKFNLFGAEARLGRFGNRVSILGSGAQRIATNDMTQIGHNVRIKIIATTRGADHEWWWNFTPSTFRKKTC